MDPDFPTRLGLIRSEDAGESWEILSLGGEVDVHALRVVHGSVYGWDAGTGRMMVSADGGQTWETLSTLDLRDIVVDPEDSAVLLATTQQGLQRSSDGGTTWALVLGTPTLAVLDWTIPTSLYGISPDGSVHRSTDGGMTWSERASVEGAPKRCTSRIVMALSACTRRSPRQPSSAPTAAPPSPPATRADSPDERANPARHGTPAPASPH